MFISSPTVLPHKVLYYCGLFIIVLLSVTLFSFKSVDAGSVNRMIVLSVDEYEPIPYNTTIYSLDPSYGDTSGYYSWIKQISSASDPFSVKMGGERIMALLNDGTLLTKDSLYSNWVTQTTGVLWMDIGSNGEMMIINSAGNAYSKKGGLYDSWVQQTSGGGTDDVAVGGNGRLMVIDSAGNAYSKESTYDSWIKQVDGALDIEMGSTGQMVVINSAGDAYSKHNRVDPWVQQTSGGGTEKIEVGGTGRLMVIDSAGNAYSKESTYEPWIKQVDGAKSIAVSSTGRMAVINNDWNVYYKDAPTLDWNLVYRLSYAKSYNYHLYLN